MFDECPEREFVHEKSSDSTFEGGEDESETPWAKIDSSVGKLDSTGRNESDCGKVAANGVFVMVDVDFEDENEKSAEEIKDDMFNSSKDESNRPLNNDVMLKDIEEWRASKSEISLALGSVNVANTLDVGGGTKEKVSEIGTLKEEVKDGDLNGNGKENGFEESENVEYQSCEEQYKFDLSSIVSEENLFIFDPGGYEKEMNGSTEVRLNDVAIINITCRVVAGREDVGAKFKKWRERVESRSGIEGVGAVHGCGRRIANNGSIFVKIVVHKVTEEAEGGVMTTDIKAKNSLKKGKETGNTKQNGREWVADNFKVGDSQINAHVSSQFWVVANVVALLSDVRLFTKYIDLMILEGDEALIVDVHEDVKSLTRSGLNFHVDISLTAIPRAWLLVKNISEINVLDVTPLPIGLVTLHGVIGCRDLLLNFRATKGSISVNIDASIMINLLELVGLLYFIQDVKNPTKKIWGLDPEFSGSKKVAVLCNMEQYLCKLRDPHVTGFEVACKEGGFTDESMRDSYIEAFQVVSSTATLQMGVGQDIPAAIMAIHASQ
ncbi:hypothetical protein POM88_028434 [Heracleum sosnowskyi]|uniref:Uncharacterized protein n=1 Tax=Heracleum sosnowskyi TaxID=360622 RepID=A0AAD8MG98_9APIA|nr:hypothetical protein POM88_028434 [Heracleum sosnowskyi]